MHNGLRRLWRVAEAPRRNRCIRLLLKYRLGKRCRNSDYHHHNIMSDHISYVMLDTWCWYPHDGKCERLNYFTLREATPLGCTSEYTIPKLIGQSITCNIYINHTGHHMISNTTRSCFTWYQPSYSHHHDFSLWSIRYHIMVMYWTAPTPLTNILGFGNSRNPRNVLALHTINVTQETQSGLYFTASRLRILQ